MKKEDFNSWLASRVQTQVKITISACVAMSVLGLLAFLFQGGLLYALLTWGYGRFIAVMALLGIFGGMGVFTWLTAPKTLCDEVHEVSLTDSDVKIRIAPSMASAWTFAIGTLESDQSVPERIFGMMMLVPRMFWTAWYLSSRIKDVREIDVTESGKVLRLALKKAEKVEAAEIADKFSKMNLPEILRQVSLIEGVVFLTKGKLGISLATRFRDDLEQGLPGIGSSSATPASPFDE